MKKSILVIGQALIASAALIACGGEDFSATRVVNLDFAMAAGDTVIQCGDTIKGVGTTGVDAQLQDARFYVSNIYLIKENGQEVRFIPDAANEWNHVAGDNSVSLIDLEDATGGCPADTGTSSINSRLSATIENATYTGVRFVVGVPFAINHTNTTASDTPRPLQSQEMAWSWQGGRKFTQIELTKPTGATWTAPVFNFHLGSTGCTGANPAAGQIDSCTNPNRMTVPLTSFNPDTQKIAFDVKALVAAEDVTVNDGGSAGCMSFQGDPDCANVFDALQIDFTSGKGTPIAGGAAQRVFKAVAKF